MCCSQSLNKSSIQGHSELVSESHLLNKQILKQVQDDIESQIFCLSYKLVFVKD
jgi:hypothetical protein